MTYHGTTEPMRRPHKVRKMRRLKSTTRRRNIEGPRRHVQFHDTVERR